LSNLRKIPYTKPLPSNAEVFTRKGKRFARWVDGRGKRREAELTEDGQRVRLLSSKWYGEWKDPDGTEHCEPLFTDRTASEQELARRVKKAELRQAGVSDPFEQHSNRPLAEHLADYRRELEARGNVPAYVASVASRLETLLAGCGFVHIADLSASRAADWLAGLRRQGPPPAPLEPGKEWFTRREAGALLGIKPRSVGTAVRRLRLASTGFSQQRRYPRATVETLQERLCRGASIETSNQYLSHLKSFCRWLVKDRRMGDNPMAHLSGGNVKVDRRHDRRELAADELRRLLEVTRGSDRTFRVLAGPDRYALYATACGTGFRAAALASLTPESFDLDAGPPTVTLAARRNKSRVLKVQPLPPDVAGLLREYLDGKPAGQPVWGGTCWVQDAAEMLRRDLEAAGIPYAVEGPDGPLYVDFHALRHTYLTLGGRAGIDLRTLQELAGHSKPELTARYSHRRLHDLAGAVEKLPSFLPGQGGGAAAGALRGTGTDGPGGVKHIGTDACDGESLRQACAAGEAGLSAVRPAETTGQGRGDEEGGPKPFRLQGDAAGRGALRAFETDSGTSPPARAIICSWSTAR
jgi:integrase